MKKDKNTPALCTKFIADFFNLSFAHKHILLKISNKKEFSKETVVQIEEALFLKQLTEWEIFTYNILTYCVSIDTKQLSKSINIPLPPMISFDNAKAILSGMNFTTFSNIKELNSLANKVIVGKHNPFHQFLKPMTVHIDEAIIIRNYISHKSNSSKQKLIKVYKKYGIKSFIEPGEFLRTERNFKIKVLSFSNLCDLIFLTISRLTWRLLDRDMYQIAHPNDSITSYEEGFANMYVMFYNMSEFKDPNSPLYNERIKN